MGKITGNKNDIDNHKKCIKYNYSSAAKRRQKNLFGKTAKTDVRERLRGLVFPEMDIEEDTKNEEEEEGAIGIGWDGESENYLKKLKEKDKTLDAIQSFLDHLLITLDEKNNLLFERIVCRCGIPLCTKLLNETLLLENSGGLMTTDNKRRSLGGIFIYLLKQRIPANAINFIWREQKYAQSAYKKDRNKNATSFDKLISKLTKNKLATPEDLVSNHTDNHISSISGQIILDNERLDCVENVIDYNKNNCPEDGELKL